MTEFFRILSKTYMNECGTWMLIAKVVCLSIILGTIFTGTYISVDRPLLASASIISSVGFLFFVIISACFVCSEYNNTIRKENKAAHARMMVTYIKYEGLYDEFRRTVYLLDINDDDWLIRCYSRIKKFCHDHGIQVGEYDE